MTTRAWSPRVGQIWQDAFGEPVEIIAEHQHAKRVQIRHFARDGSVWVRLDELECLYHPVRCKTCGHIAMRRP